MNASSISIALVVLACVFGGALAGLFLRQRLPGHHLKEDSKDIVKLGIGVIATMTALVLGLLVSSAKNSFDRLNAELTITAAKVIELDRALARLGPETQGVRVQLRKNYAAVLEGLFAPGHNQAAHFSAPDKTGQLEGVQIGIRQITVRTDIQRDLQTRAVGLAGELASMRWLLLLQERESISMPLLVVVVTWLSLIFLGFGLFSPRNATVVTALFLCALSVSGAVFLILEMDRPLDGIVRISEAPMRAALGFLGQ